MQLQKSRNKTLAFAISPLAFAVASGIALAEEPVSENIQAQQTLGTVVETIEVRGTRLQNQRVVQAKRDTDGVADFVSADDIAQLPDFNVAEALRRIPGVSLELDFRFDREGYVSVRGLNSTYNYTQLDGGIISSTANNERTVLLDVIPSSVLSRADVYKTFSPEQEGQAIGGYISLNTRSAFDKGAAFANFSADYGITEHKGWDDKGPTFRLSGTYSNTFGKNDDFGFTFAGTYAKEDRYLYNPSVRTYYYYDPTSGQRLSSDEAYASESDVYSAARIDAQFAWRYDREYFGGLSKFEWQPSDSSYTFVQGFYYDFFERSDRQGVEWDWRARPQPFDQTEFTGRVEETVRSTPALVTWDTTNKLWSLQAGGDYTLSSGDEVTFNVLYGVGQFKDPTAQYRTGFDATADGDDRLAYSYDHGGNIQNFPVRTLIDDSAYNDLSLYGALPGHRYWGNDNTESTFEAQADYRTQFKLDKDTIALKFGAKVRTTEREQDQEWLDLDLNRDVPLDEYNLGLFVLETDFFLPTGTHNHELFITDQDALEAYVSANPDNFTPRASTLSRSIISDFSVEETVFAGYAQAEYENGPFEFIGGVRYEKTKVESSGFRPSTDVNDANGFTTIFDDNTYDNWLPRALLTYDVSEQVVAKASFSKSVSRPSYNALRANKSTFTYDPVFNTASISGGNTDLEPRTSDNFDVSLEYFPEWVDGLFSLAVFRKDIAGELATPRITTQGVVITPNLDGGFVFGGNGADTVTVDLTSTIPINLDEYSIKGIELGTIINDFGFIHPALEIFGASANYTRVSSDASVTNSNGVMRELPTLIGQPENLANLSFFLQYEKFEARLAYNYQSEYLYTVSGSPADDDIWNERGIISAQVRYNISENFIIQARSNNLTGKNIDSKTGLGNFRQLRDSGTLHWIGFVYTY